MKTYIAIDLKSFYASVECRERGLNPLTTNLVVADASRTEKTICLAVTPSLKAYGVSGRARLFEVVSKVKEINAFRKEKLKGKDFTGKSFDSLELKNDKFLQLDYIAAIPRMALYMKYSNDIFNIYLRYVAPEDIHIYSVDEVFMDVTSYLKNYHMTGHELARKMIDDVLKETGITATAGIAENMYLCKVAMDIVAKHIPADKDGVRIAEINEMTYRQKLWDHTPITDFWRVGRGYARTLSKYGIHTMGEVARTAVENEDLLYKLFGVNAELLIDHAFGWEPCTIADVKAYVPENNSLGAGQVLQSPYECKKARLIVHEMMDLLSLDLVDKGLVTNQIVLTIGYDIINLTDPVIRSKYKGEVVKDHYGRLIPKHSHGTYNFTSYTSSSRELIEGVLELFDEIVNPDLYVRRLNVTACKVITEKEAEQKKENSFTQMNLLEDFGEAAVEKERHEKEIAREKKAQEAILKLKKKYGKNAVVKGMNLEEGATTIQRNAQIGGHKA